MLKLLFHALKCYLSSHSSPITFHTQDSRTNPWASRTTHPPSSRYWVQTHSTQWFTSLITSHHRIWSQSPPMPSAVEKLASIPFALANFSLDLDSRFKQKELCKLNLTFFARFSSSIVSFALVLSVNTLPTLFQPVVIPPRWVSRGLLKASGPISAIDWRYSFCCFFMWFFVEPYSQKIRVARNHEKNRMQLHTSLTSMGTSNTSHAVSNNSSLLL